MPPDTQTSRGRFPAKVKVKATKRARYRSSIAVLLVLSFLYLNWRIDPSSFVWIEYHEGGVAVVEGFPSVYWIDSGTSETHRNKVQEMLSGLPINEPTRIRAFNATSTSALIAKRHFILSNSIQFDNTDKIGPGQYNVEDAASLLSHFATIQRAKEDGQEIALILEDNAHVDAHFVRHLPAYVDMAPAGWKILQFATSQPSVWTQGAVMLDPFQSWNPMHASTRAYVVNRDGMDAILSKVHSVKGQNQDVWTLTGQPMVLPDEVLYDLAGDTYTTTRLRVGFMEPETLHPARLPQEGKTGSNFATPISQETPSLGELSTTALALNSRQESLLILMSLRISSLDGFQSETVRVAQDSDAVCKFHDICVWEINAVVTSNDLLGPVKEKSSSFPSNIRWSVSVSADPFNKFGFIRNHVENLDKYDYVLFKDNDQRLAGLPWCTFWDRKGDATMAGPLRMALNEAMIHNTASANRQQFYFHDAQAWIKPWEAQWSTSRFESITPTEVPFLEMYLVLFEGKFAKFFFDTILTPQFRNQPSAWGADGMWCVAAKQFYPDRPACHLVPLVSIHDDTRQLQKTQRFYKLGHLAYDYFASGNVTGDWMHATETWREAIRGRTLSQVATYCRKTMKWPAEQVDLDINSCAMFGIPTAKSTATTP